VNADSPQTMNEELTASPGQRVGFRKAVFLFGVFVFAWKDDVVTQLLLLQLGSVNVYPMDLALVACGWGAWKWIRSRGWRFTAPEGIVLAILLGWLVVAVVRGLPPFGFKAIGEARSLFPLFTFFLPVIVLVLPEERSVQEISATLQATTVALLFGVGVSLCESYLVEGKALTTTDEFRGERFLTGNQTFYMLMFVVMILMRWLTGLRTATRLTLMVLPLLLCILSKNRAPFVALGFGLAFLLVAERRFRLLVGIGLSVAAGIFALLILFPSLQSDLATAYGGLLDPLDDPTGRWRAGIQLAALEQSLDHPWVGQGFGGYFSFVSDDPNYFMEYVQPPHNQFLLLLLKAGLPALLLSLVAIVTFVRRSRKLGKRSAEPSDRWMWWFLQVLIGSQLVYGLVYEFFPLFGVFFGFGVMLHNATESGLVRRHAADDPVHSRES
jgi:O-antigen ligase